MNRYGLASLATSLSTTNDSTQTRHTRWRLLQASKNHCGLPSSAGRVEFGRCMSTDRTSGLMVRCTTGSRTISGSKMPCRSGVKATFQSSGIVLCFAKESTNHKYAA